MMDALARQITEFITSGPDNDAEATLERLALTLFDRQYRAIAPYRRLYDTRESSALAGYSCRARFGV